MNDPMEAPFSLLSTCAPWDMAVALPFMGGTPDQKRGRLQHVSSYRPLALPEI